MKQGKCNEKKLLNKKDSCDNLELKLREEIFLLKSIINTVPHRIFWKNTKSKYQGANTLFLEDANLCQENDIIGMSDYDMIWANKADKYRADDKHIMEMDIDKLEYEESVTNPDGSLTWLSVSSVPLKNKNGETSGVLGIYHDITTLKENELNLKLNSDALHYQAYHDVLTGLPNRLLFKDRLAQSISRGKLHPKKIAILFMDIDNFKDINDSLGHLYGDETLKIIAKRLKKLISESDTVSRFGGDEFVILIDDIHNNMHVIDIIQKIEKSMEEVIVLDESSVRISLSIGISIYPRDGVTSNELLKHSDIAMYRAKDAGRSRYEFYEKEMTEKVLSRIKKETDLREALDNEDFVLYYQPQFDMRNKKVIGVEALVRWKYNEQQIIAPSEFIPMLEKTGLIVPLGQWIAKKCMEQIVSWKKQKLEIERIAINFSMLQIKEDDFVSYFKALLKKTSCNPKWIEIEITESQVMEDPKHIIVTLNAIHALGVKLAIDDFGTGYSFLTYLKRLPIDKIKIDRSFISDIVRNKEDKSIVKAIIALSVSMNINVIAEGIETKSQEKFLLEHGCYIMQGFLYSKPVPVREIENILKLKYLTNI